MIIGKITRRAGAKAVFRSFLTVPLMLSLLKTCFILCVMPLRVNQKYSGKIFRSFFCKKH